MKGVTVKGVRVQGANVAELPSHHIITLDHRIPQRGTVTTLDHHIANLPAHPTILTFEKRKNSETLRGITGKK